MMSMLQKLALYTDRDYLAEKSKFESYSIPLSTIKTF